MTFWFDNNNGRFNDEASREDAGTTSRKEEIAKQYPDDYEAQIRAMMPDFVNTRTESNDGVTHKTQTLSAVEGDGLQRRAHHGTRDGVVHAGYGREAYSTDADGHGQRSGGYMSLEGSLDGGSVRTDVVSGDAMSRVATGLEVGAGTNGATAVAHREQRLSSSEEDYQTRANYGGIKDGSLVLGQSDRSVITQDAHGPLRPGEELQGERSEAASSHGLVIDADQMAYTRSRSQSTTHADGSGTATSSEMSVDAFAGKGSVSSTRETTDADGKVKSRALSAQGEFSEGTVAASGAAEMTSGKLSVSLKGGLSVTASPPQKTNSGKWQVAWQRSMSVGGGAGGTMGPGKAGAEANVRSGQGGTRVFDTASEADAYYKSKAWAVETATLGDAVASPEQALKAVDAMANGESLSDSSEVGAGANGSVGLGPVSIGVHATGGNSHSFNVTKANETTIVVEISDASMFGAGGSLSGVGGGLNIGTSGRDFTTQRLSFDISTDAGRAAFVALRTNRQVPASGVRVLSSKKGNETTDAFGGELLGLKVGTTRSLLEEETIFEDGRRESRSEGGEGIGAEFFGMKFSQKDSLDVVDGRDGESTYVSTTTVDATSKAETEHALSQSADTYSKNRHKSGDASGGWSLQSTFSEGQIATIVDKCASGRFQAASLLNRSDAGEVFVGAVRSARGNKARIRRALAVFVRDAGRDGLKHLRAIAGGTYEHDLALAGDKYWLGTAGRIRLEQQVTRLEEAATDGAQPQSEVLMLSGRLIAEQHDRLAALLNSDRYSEVPQKIRQREVTRTRRAIARLRAIAAKAKTQVESRQQEEANRDVVRGDDGEALMSQDAYTSVAPQQTSDGLSADQAMAHSVATKFAGLAPMRTAAKAARSQAHKHHWVLVEDPLDNHPEYYKEELSGGVAAYEEANVKWEVATDGTGRMEKLLAEAAALDSGAGDLKARLDYLYELVRDNLLAAHAHFNMANVQFGMVKAVIAKSPWDMTRDGRTQEMPEYRRD